MHIILYVADALRADHLNCYGYHRQLSPNIDTIAKEGVIFERCFTSSTWTRPVAASLLTGLYPGVHQTQTRSDKFLSISLRLPHLLNSMGFRTAAFSTMGNVSTDVGFEPGFDEFSNLFRDPEIISKRRRLDAVEEGLISDSVQKIALPWAEDINPFLFRWLECNRLNSTFSFVWSIETHVPYVAPPHFRRFSRVNAKSNAGEREDIQTARESDRQRIIDLYDDEIFYNDHCIGEIVDYLKSIHIYEDTLLVLVGDHGDSFYEHGVYTHGHMPYEELIHVPMIIKLPNSQYVGKRIDALVELIDIFPTILNAAGISPDMKENIIVQGVNLLPLIQDDVRKVKEYVFSDTQMVRVHNRYLSIRGDRWKYIQVNRPERSGRNLKETIHYVLERRLIVNMLRSPRHFIRNYFNRSNEFLFDLENDPQEQFNLAGDRTDVARELKDILWNWQLNNQSLASKYSFSPGTLEESDLLRNHLEELGYL
jgi:arylsulfatase A-like enzyme